MKEKQKLILLIVMLIVVIGSAVILYEKFSQNAIEAESNVTTEANVNNNMPENNENQNEDEEGDKYQYKALLLGFDYHCEEDYLKHIKKGDTFLLIPEPENPYDHNAIAAYKEGELRAYVMRADAKRLHNVVKEPTECYVTLVSFNSVYVGFDV